MVSTGGVQIPAKASKARQSFSPIPLIFLEARLYYHALTITRRILIVDDKEDILRLLRFYFTKLGWEVASASSGAAALEAFKADKFHMLLADVDLGEEIDGIELARRLLDQYPHLKILMMSGKSENESRVRDANLGHFIAKPFDLLRLGNILNAELA